MGLFGDRVARHFGSETALGADGQLVDPVPLPDGTSRVFLEDGDVLTIGAGAPGEGGSVVGFGEVTGTIRAAAVDT